MKEGKKPKYVQISMESYTYLNGLEDQVKSYEEQVQGLEDEIRELNEKLSEANGELKNKENLVKQHTKVAEEAVSGWEKAEAEATALKNHLESVTLLKLTAEDRAAHLDGWSGAKLAQLLQEAALVAVRKCHSAILQSDMDEVVDRPTVGPKRIGIDLCHQGQCRGATTEVGTALTSHLLRRLENAKIEPCDRVSIHPRGQTLSQVVFNRLDDEHYIFERRPQLLHQLQVLLGGRAVEEVIFGRDTSKASVSYLADASWLACKIITVWNLEETMVVHGQPPPWRKRVKFVGPRIDFEGSMYDDYDLIVSPINFKLDDDVARRNGLLKKW